MSFSMGKVATNVICENGITKVYYHNTCIVEFSNNHVLLNTGGWNTVTTKRRMNQVSEWFNLGFTVYQKNFIWYVQINDRTIEFDDTTCLIHRW